MGGLPSTLQRQERQQLTVCAVDVLSGQEHQQSESQSDATGGHSQQTLFAVDPLAEQEDQQGEMLRDETLGHRQQQPDVYAVGEAVGQQQRQREVRSDEMGEHGRQQPAVYAVDALAEQQRRLREMPSGVTTDGHRQWKPADIAVDALVEECWQEEEAVDVTDRRGQTVPDSEAETVEEVRVKRLVAGGASVRAAYDHQQTALMVAASAGAVGLCELLVDAGADVGARDRCGRTALHVAVEAEGDGGARVVELLLRHGADARAQDSSGRTPLHCALQVCNLAAAEALLPVAGQPLLADSTGRTELHWAAANGTNEMVRRLAELAGSGTGATDGAGMTPLARALQARNREAAVVLLQVPGACPREVDGVADAFGRTVLHWAAHAGYPEVVRHLLERGFPPWEKDLCGRDATLWAVESGERQAVEAILEAAGYRECVDGRGQTALHVAAARGDAAVVARLLERGADAGRQDSMGRTPLAYALRGAHREVSFLLALRNPPNLRRRDLDERTLLHWAAVGGDADAVRALLADGAAVNAVDARSKTAASLAVEHGHEEAAAALVGADGFRVLHDGEGRTPLHGAAAAGWTSVAEQLVARGADPHQGGADYLSPVMLAVRAGHYSLARNIARARWFSK